MKFSKIIKKTYQEYKGKVYDLFVPGEGQNNVNSYNIRQNMNDFKNYF